jgi:hypothetical protein
MRALNPRHWPNIGTAKMLAQSMQFSLQDRMADI